MWGPWGLGTTWPPLYPVLSKIMLNKTMIFIVIVIF